MLILTGMISKLDLSRALSIFPSFSIAPVLRCVTLSIVFLSGMVMLSHPGSSALTSDGEQIGYQAELARVSHDLSAKLNFTLKRPGSWLHLEQVANAYLERAHLTGDFEDYFAAQTVMAEAFVLSGERVGPVLSRAKMHFTMHRLPAVEADLAKAEAALLVDATTIESIRGIRADVFFYRSQYTQAKHGYDQLELSNPSVISASRLAHYHAHVADYSEAERWFEKAQERVLGQSAHLRSWLKLQLGILDLERGRLDDALAHYQEGLELFPGYWLLEEHVAEIDGLQGRNKEAEESYRDLILRTGSPLFMGALANILDSRVAKNDRTESLIWREKANALYEARILRMPELTSGHAIEHFLHSGDSSRALQLAQTNYELRPGGQAALLLIQAYSALGQVPKASALLDLVLTSRYRSASLHATAGVIDQAQNLVQQAEMHNAVARAINPFAVDEIRWLRIRLDSASI